MAVLIGFLAFVVLMGAAAVLGRTSDSRNPEFGLGAVTRPQFSGRPTGLTGKVCGPEPRFSAPGTADTTAPVAQTDRATAF